MAYDKIVRYLTAQIIVDLVREKKVKFDSLASTAGAGWLSVAYVYPYIDKMLGDSLEPKVRDLLAELVSMMLSKTAFNLVVNYFGLKALSDSDSRSVERQLMLSLEDAGALVIADKLYSMIMGEMNPGPTPTY